MGMESKINICWKHTLKTSEVMAAIREVERDMASQWGAKTTWQGQVAHFRCESGIAKGVTGAIEVEAAVVRMVVELPFLIRAFAQKIREGIQSSLREHLSGGPC